MHAGVREFFRTATFATIASAAASALLGQEQATSSGLKPAEAARQVIRENEGATIRGDVNSKRLALVFTGDQFGEGTESILDALKVRGLKGSFFVTGNFLRQAELLQLVKRIVEEGHYLGPHSDGHLLYCDWSDRTKSHVTREAFDADLTKNLAELRQLGALPHGERVLFIPPYEWYNQDQAAWCRGLGVELVNFTPGSGSNRDYAKEDDPHFASSREILDGILAYEQKDPHGLNGFILLTHLGSGAQDPFFKRLGPLCDALLARGYAIVRIDELLPPPSTSP